MRDPLSVSPTDTLRSVLDTVVAHNVRGIPVIDAAGHLIGLVDEAMLAKAYLRGRSAPGDAKQALLETSGK